ncbi:MULTISPECIES: hypothetical protein [unclassified Geodermatophilus]
MRHETSKGTFEMVLWPAVALVGFLVLTGLVIAMGTSTTARYEREQRAAASAATRRESAVTGAAVEPVGVAQAA